MLSVRINLEKMIAQAQALPGLRAQALMRAREAVFTAARDETDQLATVTPRSLVVRDASGVHVHMADRWTCEATDVGAVIRNPAPYADYVAHGTRRMNANPDLERALDDLEANITARVAGELAG